MEKIEVLIHSSIRFIGEKRIYFDPYQIRETYQDADYIFITHPHYDHLSLEDIKKVKKETTIIVSPIETKQILKQLFEEKNMIGVKPKEEIILEGIQIKTVPAYNLEKPFHPREKGWVGYLITMEDTTYYIPGDIDAIPEAKEIVCDLAFLPVGGTYTMNAKEAAILANQMNCDKFIPIHYGSIVGKKEDAEEFKRLVKKKVEIQMEE